MARPKKKKLTAKEIKTVERLAGLGLNQESIGHVLGVCDRTFRRWKAEDPKLMSAYKKGRGIGQEMAANCLRDLMKKGEVAAIIFYLKAQCGWTEKKQVSHSFTPEQFGEKIKAALKEKDELHTEADEE